MATIHDLPQKSITDMSVEELQEHLRVIRRERVAKVSIAKAPSKAKKATLEDAPKTAISALAKRLSAEDIERLRKELGL
jgi:hypothetical protein